MLYYSSEEAVFLTPDIIIGSRLPWWWVQQIPPKYSLWSPRLHGARLQETVRYLHCHFRDNIKSRLAPGLGAWRQA